MMTIIAPNSNPKAACEYLEKIKLHHNRNRKHNTYNIKIKTQHFFFSLEIHNQ